MRKCLKCGADEGITRDHVVPRVLLRQAMDLDTYQRFSHESRDVNIQPLCGPCNGEKADRAIDYRPIEEHVKLLLLLERWGLDIEVQVGKPHKSVKWVSRWCELHGHGGHRTDDCFLIKNPDMLVKFMEQRVREIKIVEEAMQRTDRRRARRKGSR